MWHLSFQSQCDGAPGESDLLSGLNIYGNDISGFNNWYDSGFNNHFDGIMLSASCYGANPSEITNANIYDNSIHGPMGQWGTGMIYGANHLTNSYIYNNLLVLSYASFPGGDAHPDGLIVLTSGSEGGPTNVGVYNNTFWFDTQTQGVGYRFADVATNVTLENNILVNPYRILDAYYTNIADPGYGLTTEYNIYFNLGSQYVAQDNLQNNGNYFTLAQWQAIPDHSYDAQVGTGDPKLDPNYKPQLGSSAIGFGTNLTSLNVSGLDVDKANLARPAAGNWDDGAYDYPTTIDPPAPPSNLAATVH